MFRLNLNQNHSMLINQTVINTNLMTDSLSSYFEIAKGTFLEQDRNSNFPSENTIKTSPTQEQVKAWMRDSNHNEPMFYQVACRAAEWGYQKRCLEELSELGHEMKVGGNS